jgi:FxsC-like protein
MSHVLFLSYTSKDAQDAQFKGFFKDLCQYIATNTAFEPEDDELAFRDRKNLKIGEKWEPELRDALEVSSVFVCLTSPKYFTRAFCGREFYVFDQRIKKYARFNGLLPPAIIPVIWAPHPMPPIMETYVWKADFPEVYEQIGLRELRWFKSAHYKRILAAIGRRIVDVWNMRQRHAELASGVVLEFDQIPNAFGGEIEEASNSEGWIHGPGVANVVYGAGTKHAVPSLGIAPKYGDSARDWKPYLPPSPQTVADLTMAVVHGQTLKYREIPVDDNLEAELVSAQKRKNLVVMVADAASITDEKNSKLSKFDQLKPEGTALLMPWDESQQSPWTNEKLQRSIDRVFPVKSRTPACYRAPILSVDQMRSTLDTTLVEIRDSLTKLGASSKPIGDVAPATVSGTVAL